MQPWAWALVGLGALLLLCGLALILYLNGWCASPAKPPAPAYYTMQPPMIQLLPPVEPVVVVPQPTEVLVPKVSYHVRTFNVPVGQNVSAFLDASDGFQPASAFDVLPPSAQRVFIPGPDPGSAVPLAPGSVGPWPGSAAPMLVPVQAMPVVR